MGIFGVNLPLLSGEGKKAFVPLQEEIMKISDDYSLFTWGLTEHVKTAYGFQALVGPWSDIEPMQVFHGLLADSPAEFTFNDKIGVIDDLQPDTPTIHTSSGMRIELPTYNSKDGKVIFATTSCIFHG